MTNTALLLIAATTIATTLATSNAAAAELELSVATRTPLATVTSYSGLGTSDAKAVGAFTAKAKREQCEGYHTDEASIRACIASWDATLAGVVAASANCPGGILFFGGARYAYAGEWPAESDGRRITKWQGPDTRIVALGMASEAYPLDRNWRTLCPGVKPAAPKAVEAIEPARAAPKGGATAEPTGRPWSHNGSFVFADLETGMIVYDVPKAAIRSVARHGTVLFRGKLLPGKVEGTAYAFKEGCPPAPYPVKGVYSDRMYTLTLRGAGPVRKGCEVVSYSERSPHAVLKFSYILND